MKERTYFDMKEKFRLILGSLGMCLFADLIILRLLPRTISKFALQFGYQLQVSDLVTKYCMGIVVRAFGILIFLFLLRKMKLNALFTYKIKWQYLFISWMFFLYTAVNIEFVDLGQVRVIAVLCMILESMVIGFFEELVFRGTILTMLLNKYRSSRQGILFSVITSSVIFGLFHINNLFTGQSPVIVFSQVIYTTILGVAFSAIFLRTNHNLLWCCLLHGFYDMASGFGDFAQVTVVTQQTVHKAVSIMPQLINIATFLPLFIYSLILLRKVKVN